MSFEDDLTRATAACAARDLEAALEAALEAWRARPAPALGDAIERLSAELGRARPPVVGKTKAKFFEAWFALAKKKRAADLARLLELEWPGRWQDALEVAEALRAFKRDPRLASALVAVVLEGRYQTWTGANFYKPVLERIVRLGDPRSLVALRAFDPGGRTSYFRDGVPPLVADAVRALEKLPPVALDAAEERALAALLAVVPAEGAPAPPGDDALEARLRATPRDPELLAVWADRLTERQDPQGELIALALAEARGALDAPGAKRMRALIAKHGLAFAGELAPYFRKDGLELELGVFAGGALAGQVPPREICDGERWRAVTVVDLDRVYGDTDAIWAGLRLREAHGVRARQLSGLLASPSADTLETLALSGAFVDEPAARAALARPGVLPKLHTLGMAARDAAWFLDTELATRVRVILAERDADGWLAALRDRPALPARLETVRAYWGRSALRPQGFVVELRVGPAIALSARWVASDPDGLGLSRLADLVRELPPGMLAAVTIGPGASPDHRQRADLAAALALHGATLTSPWPDVAGGAVAPAASAPASVAVGPTRALVLSLRGPTPLADPARLTAIWEVAQGLCEASPPFADVRVNHTRTRRPLGERPLDVLRKWADKETTRTLTVGADVAGAAELSLHREGYGRLPEVAPLELAFGSGRTVDELGAALVDAMVRLDARAGAVRVAGGAPVVERLRAFSPPAYEWASSIWALGPELARHVADADLDALRALPGAAVSRRQGVLCVSLGATPEAVDGGLAARFEQALEPGLLAATLRRLGYDPRALVRERLAGLGLSFEKDERHFGWTVHFAAPGALAVRVHFADLTGATQISAHLAREGRPIEIGAAGEYRAAQDRRAAEAALDTIAAALVQHLVGP